MLVLALLTAQTAPFAVVPDASAVTQEEIDAIKGEQDTLAAQKAELEKELKELKNDKSAAMKKKTNIDKQIGVLQSQISIAEKQIGQ